MAIATRTPGSLPKLLVLPFFMAVVALTRVGLHGLHVRGYDGARSIMAPELALLLAFLAAGLRYGPFTEPAAWSALLTAALGVATLAVQNTGTRLIWRTLPSTTVMTLNVTQLALDGVAIRREPKNAATQEARERMALMAPTLGGFVAGAAAGGVGYLIAGFYSGLAPVALLLTLIFLQEKPS